MLEGEASSGEPGVLVIPHRPAGFIRRVIATLIDIVIIGILFQFFIFAGMSGLSAAVASNGLDVFGLSDLGAISLCSLFFIQLGYFSFFHSHCGQTPGKMTLRIIVVVDDTGTLNSLSPLQAFFRSIGLFISASFFGFGFLITLFGRKKRALHDHLCGTQVLLAR